MEIDASRAVLDFQTGGRKGAGGIPRLKLYRVEQHAIAAHATGGTESAGSGGGFRTHGAVAYRLRCGRAIRISFASVFDSHADRRLLRETLV